MAVMPQTPQTNVRFINKQGEEMPNLQPGDPQYAANLEAQRQAEIADLQAQSEAQQQQIAAAQQRGVEDLQFQRNLALQKPTQVDLSPMAQLIDQWTGSRLAQGYKPPQSPEERDAVIQGLQGQISQAQIGLTKEQQSYLTDKLAKQLKASENYAANAIRKSIADQANTLKENELKQHAEDKKIDREDRKERDKQLDRRLRELATAKNEAMLKAAGIRAATAANKPTAAQNKIALSGKEQQYRYNSLTKNAQDLKDIIDDVGTFEAFGPESGVMRSKIYQMAVDYAKMVDPDSVARESEVEAAQKYLLQMQQAGGLAHSNETAKKLVDQFMQDLDTRMAARQQAYGDAPPAPPGGDDLDSLSDDQILNLLGK